MDLKLLMFVFYIVSDQKSEMVNLCIDPTDPNDHMYISII